MPSHAGTPGNEKTDTAAANAVSGYVTPFDIPDEDLRLSLRKAISLKWQRDRDTQSSNK